MATLTIVKGILLFWDGKLQALDDKGGVGILINLAVLVVVLLKRF